MTAESMLERRPAGGFHHEALFYEGDDEFLAATTTFVRSGLRAGEPVFVTVGPEKIRRLRERLGADEARVTFADMAGVGRNPARVTSLWRDVAAANRGRPLRGVGEPLWPGRTADEVAECAGHESLLGIALADADLWLLCPYDTGALDRDALDVARRTHLHVLTGGAREPNANYRRPGDDVLAAPLPEPPEEPTRLPFRHSLAAVRRLVAELASRAGLSEQRVEDLLLAVNEAACNSVRHGGGSGLLRVWRHHGGLVCEIRDHGRITEPLAGRIRPEPEALAGRGLWMANHLCDLVQLRSYGDGTVLRLHMQPE